MDDSLKFTWAYMIEKGRITNGNWSYYGSSFETTGRRHDYITAEKDMEKLRKDVKDIGIDWAKTSVPESSQESGFEGTFADSSSVETLLGTLVLKDGSEYLIGVAHAETRFSEYVAILRTLMEDKQRVKDVLGE